jgi:hypothetical protein
MAPPKGEIQLEKGKHRLVEPIFLLSAICGGVSAALAFKATGKTDFAECGFQCLQIDRYVMLPLLEPLGQLLTKNAIPDQIKFRLDEHPKPSNAESGKSATALMLTKIILPFFIDFYAENSSWVKSKFWQSQKSWPSIWRFAWVVRNAAAHGEIKIYDPTMVPVSWYDLTYGPIRKTERFLGLIWR